MSVSQPTTPGHRPLSANQIDRVAAIKAAGEVFIDAIRDAVMGREAALATTNAEQAVMWAIKGVVDQ
ncbi:hypothetical protein D3C80_126950 [compost metagenome]